MYFGYQKDSNTGKIHAFKSPEIPHDLNGKPVPVIMIVHLNEPETYMNLDQLKEIYPCP